MRHRLRFYGTIAALVLVFVGGWHASSRYHDQAAARERLRVLVNTPPDPRLNNDELLNGAVDIAETTDAARLP